MGKRKSATKPQGPKKSDPLPTQFTCLFCNHEKSVHVKLDKKAGIGTLECKTCGQHFQSAIHYAVAKEESNRAAASSGRAFVPRSRARNDYEEQAEDGIADDDEYE